ncbi:MAG: hypothetical protein QOE66_2954 [Chloroflexota bacterium]|jgi:hypothetical protein|nr:hypothetical protein [Chloroflexota bacterium]
MTKVTRVLYEDPVTGDPKPRYRSEVPTPTHRQHPDH